MEQQHSNPAQLTDEAVVASVAGTTCAVCGHSKSAGQAFCRTDWYALPLPARWSLQERPSSPLFAQNFRAWLRHLQLNSDRARSLPAGPGDSPYRTLAEWYAAGYRFSRHGQCEAPTCLRSIVWVITPDPARYLAIDFKTARVHRNVCQDPSYFERRRQRRADRQRAKTSARRRRAS
jgi:hypothetical protein